jgi:hypothetical protein
MVCDAIILEDIAKVPEPGNNVLGHGLREGSQKVSVLFL